MVCMINWLRQKPASFGAKGDTRLVDPRRLTSRPLITTTPPLDKTHIKQVARASCRWHLSYMLQRRGKSCYYMSRPSTTCTSCIVVTWTPMAGWRGMVKFFIRAEVRRRPFFFSLCARSMKLDGLESVICQFLNRVLAFSRSVFNWSSSVTPY